MMAYIRVGHHPSIDFHSKGGYNERKFTLGISTHNEQYRHPLAALLSYLQPGWLSLLEHSCNSRGNHAYLVGCDNAP